MPAKQALRAAPAGARRAWKAQSRQGTQLRDWVLHRVCVTGDASSSRCSQLASGGCDRQETLTSFGVFPSCCTFQEMSPRPKAFLKMLDSSSAGSPISGLCRKSRACFSHAYQDGDVVRRIVSLWGNLSYRCLECAPGDATAGDIMRNFLWHG